MDLLGQLGSILSGPALGQISKLLGGNKNATAKAIAVALPLIISAMGRNAGRKRGAESLRGALQRDHDGGLLGDLLGFLKGGGNQADGNGILGHVLGGNRSRVERTVSNASGLDRNAVTKLLPILAPIVMGVLGKQVRQQRMDTSGLQNVLRREKRRVYRQAPGVVPNVLDTNRDGKVDAADLLKIGQGVLGQLIR